MAFDATRAAWQQDITHPGTRLVLLCIADGVSSETGICYASVGWIAKRTGLDQKTIRTSMGILRAKGILQVQERTGRAPAIRLSFPEQPIRITREDFSKANGNPSQKRKGSTKGSPLPKSVGHPYQKRQGTPTKNGRGPLPKTAYIPGTNPGTVSEDTVPADNKLLQLEADSGVNPTLRNSMDEVFEYWKAIHGYPRARFTKERRKRVKDRLEGGFPVDDLKLAIEGCKVSPHHQGKNDRNTVYDDLELICRSETHVERLMKIAERHQERKSGVEQFLGDDGGQVYEGVAVHG